MKYFNRVRVFSSTTGTGDTIAMEAAVTAAFNTLAEAGAVAGDKTAVVVEQGSDYAIYRVTVNAGVASVNIDSVIISKIGGVVGTSRLNLGGSAIVRVTDTAEDFNALLAALIAENFGSIAATPGNGAKQVQLRRGTTAQHGSFTGAPGEVTVDTDLNVLRVHDGATAGGHRTQPYDADTAKTDVAQQWTAPQRADKTALTHNTGANFSTKQNFTATVNGSAFTIANPSNAPNDGQVIKIFVTFSTTHGLSFGNKFKTTGYTPSATSGKKDVCIFEYDSGADLYYLIGFRTDVGA